MIPGQGIHGAPGRAAFHGRVRLSELPAPEPVAAPRSAPEEEDELTAGGLRASGVPNVATAAPESGTIAATPTPPVSSPAITTSFNAVDDDISYIPPDTDGAAGPDYLLTTLNNVMRIQTKAGAVVQTATISALFGLPSGTAFDPHVVYDAAAGRWIAVAVSGAQAPSSAVRLAVSQTRDPTGAWNLYSIAADPNGLSWADFPELGYNAKWVVVSVNVFANSGGAYVGPKIWAVAKSDLYGASASPRITLFKPSIDHFAISPARQDDLTPAAYLAEVYNASTKQLSLFSITGPIGSETMTLVGAPTISTLSQWYYGVGLTTFGTVPQLGAVQKIDGGDGRMHACLLRNGSIWCTHSVYLPYGAPTHEAVQWEKLSSIGTILDAGRIEDKSASQTSGSHYLYPSVAVNKVNDVFLGFSTSSASIYPSAAYAVRLCGDPAATFRTPRVYRDGLAKYFKTYAGSRNRWGDYSGTELDPTDAMTFWTIQELSITPTVSNGTAYDRWSTYWGKLGPVDGAARSNAPPINPTLTSDHPVGGTSTDNTIGMSWSGATSPCTIGGYSWAWTTDPNAPLDTVADGDRTVRTTTSPPLAAGTWYFQLRTLDGVGLWSGTITLGPFTIQTDLPAVSLDQRSLDFGSVAAGSKSAVRTATLTNSGGAALTVSSISKSGSNPAEFVVTQNCVSASPIAPGGTCSIGVQLAPTGIGSRTAQLSITDDAADSPQSIALTGTGTPPTSVGLSTTSVSFGSLGAGFKSASKTVTVTNTGSGPLTVTKVSKTGANGPDFGVSQNCVATSPVSAGGTCTIAITFKPIETGPLAAKVKIVDDASDSPQFVSLSGTGAPAPAVSLSTKLVSFGFVLVGTTSSPQTVTVTNIGTAPLHVDSVSRSGSSSFDVLDICVASSPIAVGDSCTIRVSIAPGSTGAKTGTISIVDDAPGSPQTISLSGTGA